MLRNQTTRINARYQMIPACALILSVALHYAAISCISVYSSKKQSPRIFVWPGILTANDLRSFPSKKNNPIDDQLFIDNQSERYFPNITTLNYQNAALAKQPYTFYPIIRLAETIANTHIRLRTNNLYLWEQQPLLFSQDKKTVPYKVFVSPHGEAIIIFPEKLLDKPEENNALQKYVQEASLFFYDKFFWTKLEGVVQ